MRELTAAARRLARRLVAGPAPAEALDQGIPAALTGLEALRRAEGGIVGPDHGALLEGVDGLAEALGRAGSGVRATVLLSAPELAAARPLLTAAAGRRLPLVAYGIGGRESDALGTGAVVLAPANAQEVVDLALVARRLAERALTPVVLLVGGGTARSVEEVLLPSAALTDGLLGDPGEEVPAPTPAQEALFGRRRRRVPRWHDPERPLRLGALREDQLEAPATAAGEIFFDAHLPELLEEALGAQAAATGRRHEAVGGYRLADAELLLVARGGAVETAEGVADELRSRHRVKVGVVGLRLLSPFPRDAAQQSLRGRQRVAVLEPATGGGQEALAGALQGGVEAGPSRVLTLRYAADPLPAGELAAWVRRFLEAGEAPPWLGITGDGELAERPKRQAARDALIADYPSLGRLAPHSRPPEVDIRPPGAFTLAVAGGGELAGLGGETARLLHTLVGGHLRAATSGASLAFGEGIELATWAPAPLRQPGSDGPAELGLLPLRPHAASLSAAERALLSRLGPGAALILAGEAPPASPGSLPAPLLKAARERSLEVAVVALPGGEGAASRRERLLGALLGALVAGGRLSTNLRRLLACRRGQLAELDKATRQARLDALAAGFEGARPAPPPTVSAPELEGWEAWDVPLAARRLGLGHDGAGRGTLGDVPHFWEEVASRHRQGQGHQLSPEPALAASVEPAGSAALCAEAARDPLLPAFDAGLCSGCGVCWSACPQGAIGAWVVSGGALVEHAMGVARAAGRPADALRTVAARLAEAVDAELGSNGATAAAGPLLAAAAEAVLARSPLPEERKAAVREAAAAAAEALGDLPLAVTVPFFTDPARCGDKGEALALVVDPEPCTGCGLCVVECAPGALTAAPATPERAAAARRWMEVASTLPPPSTQTVERASNHPEVGALAAAMLTAEARSVLRGGGTGRGAGSRLVVREALGVAAFSLHPSRQALVAQIAQLEERLTVEIRQQLGAGLPGRDLAALDAGLAGVGRPDAPLAELVARVADLDAPRVEVPRLRRLVAAAREVGELRHRLAGDETETGRAPFSVVVAPAAADGSGLAAWAAAFPANPFSVPATVAPPGDPVALARGIARGAVAAAVAEARILRRAHLELDQPGEAVHAGEPLAALGWADLTAEERRLAPPVILLAEEEALAPHLASLLSLLGGDLPVVVSALGPANKDGAPVRARSGLAGLDLAALAREATPASVAEISPGAPEELVSGTREALEGRGPALLGLHDPCPEALGIAPEQILARAREDVALGRFTPSVRPAIASGEAGDGAAAALAEGAGSEAAARHAEELAALSQRHARELTDLRVALEHQAAEREARLRLELAHGVRGRLLALVSRPRPAGNREEPS